ncbi:hypothetical protein D018_2132A, partial [Vibrio parahaemolyticus VP2007-007]
MEVNHS